MTSGAPWAAEEALFDPDGLYRALTALLSEKGTDAEVAFLPFAGASDLLRPPPFPDHPLPAPDPTPREAVSLVAWRPDGLLVYGAPDLPDETTPWSVAVADEPAMPWRPAPLGGDGEGLLRVLAQPVDGPLPAPGTDLVVRGGDTPLFRGPATPSTPLPPGARLQFRRFSAEGFWLAWEGGGPAAPVEGPVAVALRGDGLPRWRWARETRDKEGRSLWLVDLEGLVRPDEVQRWALALEGGEAVARGAFLTFADDQDRMWLQPPRRSGREVTVTLVRDRPRQAADLSMLLETRAGARLDGEPAADPPGFAFRTRDNSRRFLLPRGTEPSHLSIVRRGRELFRLEVGGDERDG